MGIEKRLIMSIGWENPYPSTGSSVLGSRLRSRSLDNSQSTQTTVLVGDTIGSAILRQY